MNSTGVRLARSIRFSLLGLAMLLLAGCSGDYVLRGRAVHGDSSTIQLVEPSDAQLEGSGLPGARISIWRDPTRLNRKLVASGISGADGSFAIRIEEFGAGWMEEQWLVSVVRAEYETIELLMPLPSDDDETRLLVVLRPGVSIGPQGEDLWGEYERFR